MTRNASLRDTFERTTCDCRGCSISCEHMPGALAPEDVGAIASFLGYTNTERFADEYILASEGAVVGLPDGRRVALPTLTPATDDAGACRFLENRRCSIHPVSPFGCSHLDIHMTKEEADRRSHALCVELFEDRHRGGTYASLVDRLQAADRVAPPMVELRTKLADAMRAQGLSTPGNRSAENGA